MLTFPTHVSGSVLHTRLVMPIFGTHVRLTHVHMCTLVTWQTDPAQKVQRAFTLGEHQLGKHWGYFNGLAYIRRQYGSDTALKSGP